MSMNLPLAAEERARGDRQRAQRARELFPGHEDTSDLLLYRANALQIIDTMATHHQSDATRPDVRGLHVATLKETLQLMKQAMGASKGPQAKESAGTILGIAVPESLVTATKSDRLSPHFGKGAVGNMCTLVVPQAAVTGVHLLPIANAAGSFEPRVELRIKTGEESLIATFGDSGYQEQPSDGLWHSFPLVSVEFIQSSPHPLGTRGRNGSS